MTDEVKRNNVLEAMLSGNSIEEISKIAGVSRKTIYRYLSQDNKLIEEYRNLKREQLREIADKLTTASTIAVDSIIDLSKSKDINQSVRLNACSKILELFLKTREIESNINDKVFRENKSPYEMDFNIKYISDYLYPATKVTKM